MIPVASDVHKGRCWMAMIPPGEDVKMLEPIECTREAWRQRLAELPPEAEIALEVSTSGYFVMSVLEEAGWRERAHWVHTAGIDSLRKQKSDRLDTRRLVKKLAVQDVEPLPEAWFPPPPIRELRLLARQRCGMARLRAQTKNRVNSLLEMHGLRPQRCVFTAKGRAWIQQQALSSAAQLCFERIFRLYDFLTRRAGNQRGGTGGGGRGFPRGGAPADHPRPRAHAGGGGLERDRRPGAFRLGRRPAELYRLGAEFLRQRRGLDSWTDHPPRPGLAALGLGHRRQRPHAQQEPAGPALLAPAALPQVAQCGQDGRGGFGGPLRLWSFETRSTFPGRTLGPESRQVGAVNLR